MYRMIMMDARYMIIYLRLVIMFKVIYLSWFK